MNVARRDLMYVKKSQIHLSVPQTKEKSSRGSSPPSDKSGQGRGSAKAHPSRRSPKPSLGVCLYLSLLEKPGINTSGFSCGGHCGRGDAGAGRGKLLKQSFINGGERKSLSFDELGLGKNQKRRQYLISTLFFLSCLGKVLQRFESRLRRSVSIFLPVHGFDVRRKLKKSFLHINTNALGLGAARLSRGDEILIKKSIVRAHLRGSQSKLRMTRVLGTKVEPFFEANFDILKHATAFKV